MKKLHQVREQLTLEYPWYSYSGGSGSRQVCTFDGNKHCPHIEKLVIPIEVEVRPCYVKPKVDPKFDITIRKVNYNFEEAEFYYFALLFCRDIGSSLDTQNFHLGLDGYLRRLQ